MSEKRKIVVETVEGTSPTQYVAYFADSPSSGQAADSVEEAIGWLCWFSMREQFDFEYPDDWRAPNMFWGTDPKPLRESRERQAQGK